jgi:hypothetical protein
MEIRSLIIYAVLFLSFLLAGLFKLIMNREKIIASGGTWAEEFKAKQIKMIGVLECALALGLLLPFFFAGLEVPGLLFSVMYMLSLTSSVGMCLVMLSAAYVHIWRKEYGFVILTLVLSGMAFSIAAHYIF